MEIESPRAVLQIDQKVQFEMTPVLVPGANQMKQANLSQIDWCRTRCALAPVVVLNQNLRLPVALISGQRNQPRWLVFPVGVRPSQAVRTGRTSLRGSQSAARNLRGPKPSGRLREPNQRLQQRGETGLQF